MKSAPPFEVANLPLGGKKFLNFVCVNLGIHTVSDYLVYDLDCVAHNGAREVSRHVGTSERFSVFGHRASANYAEARQTA